MPLQLTLDAAAWIHFGQLIYVIGIRYDHSAGADIWSRISPLVSVTPLSDDNRETYYQWNFSFSGI